MKAILLLLKSMAFLLLLLMMTCCKTSKSNEEENTITISLNDLKKNDLNSIDFHIEKTEFIPLETNEDCLIDGVNKMILNEGDYYIQTNKSLLKFSDKGKFITQVGKQGNGPGEFNLINNFCIMHDSIYIFDGNKDKVIVFDSKGKFEREINDTHEIKFIIDIIPLNSGEAIIANGINFDNQKDLYALWNPNSPLHLKSIMTTSLVSEGNYAFSPHPMASDEDNILFFTPFENKIYKFIPTINEISSYFEISNVGFPYNENMKYSEVLTDALMENANLILNLYNTDKYLLINLYNGSIVWNKSSENGCFLETSNYFPVDSIAPFYPLLTKYSKGNTIFSIRQASEFIESNWINDPSISNFFKNINISNESNPIIVKYSVR